MNTRILVIAFPSVGTIVEKIGSAIEDVFNDKPIKWDYTTTNDVHGFGKVGNDAHGFGKDLTPTRFKNHSFVPSAPVPQWGVSGKEADENLRFGYGLEVDEPRRSDYNERWKFESDHAAFDRFVEAGEDCVARGLEKKSNAPITKCNAVRKRLNEAPPMRDELPSELIGETQWFDEDLDWNF